MSFDYSSEVAQVEPKEIRKLLQYLEIATRSNRESMVDMFAERLLSVMNYDCGDRMLAVRQPITSLCVAVAHWRKQTCA